MSATLYQRIGEHRLPEFLRRGWKLAARDNLGWGAGRIQAVLVERDPKSWWRPWIGVLRVMRSVG